MCAIFGFISRRRRPIRFDIVRDIVAANIIRGPHAFGFAWIDSRGRLHAYKQTGRLTDHFGALGIARDARLLIGHLRWATHGDPSENLNNHPHPVDGGWLVHNGVVRNYEALVRTKQLWNVSACDSEAIGLLIERMDGTRLARSARAAAMVEGNLATLALWSRPDALVAVRRGNPLHVARDESGVYLATLRDGLPGKPLAVRDNSAVQFAPRGGMIHVQRRAFAAPAASRVVWPAPVPTDQLELYRGG